MSASRPYLPDALHTIAPWIAATAALLMAFVILSQFIDTLHVSMQRGQTFRSTQYQQNSLDSHAATRVADATPHDVQAGGR